MRVALLAALVAATAGCGAAAPPERTTLTVFAAASLSDAADALAAEYQRVEPDVRLRTAFDASSALRAQIEQGAGADLFLSADERYPRALADAGLALEPVPFAGTGLAIVVPARGDAALLRPFDLADPGIRIVAAGEAVPITRYADELVARIGALPGAPDGFAERYRANIVSREDNVRAILAKVALGEADAGIVYATDARGADVRALPLPADVAVTATFTGTVVASSPRREDAAAFLAWIASAEGRRVLERFGFGAPQP